MPELPEMQALSERLDAEFVGAALVRADQLGFTALKTFDPDPDSLLEVAVTGVGRRGKYLVLTFDGGRRILIHLSQAGRLDVESPPKTTKPRGAVVRLVFDNGRALLVREYGTQRKAGWWILAPEDPGPLATLGPEATDPAFAELVLTDDSTRQLHTLLRDQRVVAGIGRGYADDILNRAGLSPFAALRSLDQSARRRLLDAVDQVLDQALVTERQRTGGLSDAKLGDRFAVHNRAGQPCPQCGQTLHRVSFDSHEIAYCPHCQTHGRVLADRRLSRLLR
jgi:formamidopyrimidine-DNA glycosylase